MKYKMNKRWKTVLIACFSICLSVNNLSAQTVWEDMVEQLMVNYEDNSYSLENVMEDLADLKNHPIHINQATKEDLERFPFLSDKLIENILYYIYKYGPMLSEKELMMVEDMDQQTARCLAFFITFQQSDKENFKPTLKHILKYGKQEFSTRMDIPFYTKSGYANNRYLGSSFSHNFRYSFRYGDKVYVGLTAEKDAGEPFFAKNNKYGYDYYSPYLLIKNRGRLKTLALGNYRLNYGYGIVMNMDFNMGKTSMLATLSNKSTGIKKHSSTDEYNYFQGIAASMYITDRLTIDAFYSYRKMDGIVDNLFITSVKKDGYHRLSKDIEKENKFTNQLIGSNLYYNGKYFELGLTGVYNVFNKRLNTTYRTYNKYYPRGNSFFNLGINYKLFFKRFTLLGETAVDKNGKIATLNMLRYSPKGSFQLIVMNRFYDVAYQSLYASSVGEGSSVQNESGFYIGLETNILRYFKLTTYGDFFYFPWKKYQISKNGTKGFDGTIQLNYSPCYELDMFIKYRYKNKYKDFVINAENKQTIPYIQQKLRYQINYSPNDNLKLKTIVDLVHNGYQQKKPSKGILIGQNIGYSLKKIPLQLDFSAAWFHTDDYASRISIYEKGLLYAFSIPTFYGQGERFTLNVRHEWNKHLIFQAKYACTHYRDRKMIGSGLEQIQGTMKNDLYLQIRYIF